MIISESTLLFIECFKNSIQKPMCSIITPFDFIEQLNCRVEKIIYIFDLKGNTILSVCIICLIIIIFFVSPLNQNDATLEFLTHVFFLLTFISDDKKVFFIGWATKRGWGINRAENSKFKIQNTKQKYESLRSRGGGYAELSGRTSHP